ncbi:MAG TPA: ERV1/ALR-related protein [Allocoleopsis sp.]
MKTKEWGSSFWFVFFTMIQGAYPYKIDHKNKDHIKTKRAFIGLFNNLKRLLPCHFCRESYCKFYRELPIENFSSGRINMMKWLYLMKDRVNRKLISQEKQELIEKKKEYISGKISKEEYSRYLKSRFKTIKTPKFEKVLDSYEKMRATCKK